MSTLRFLQWHRAGRLFTFYSGTWWVSRFLHCHRVGQQFTFIGKGVEGERLFLHWHRMGQHFFLHWHRDVNILLFTLAQGWSTVSFLMVERINFEVFVKVLSEPMKILLSVSPCKENRRPHEPKTRNLRPRRESNPRPTDLTVRLLDRLSCEARREQVPLFNGTGWINFLLFMFPQRWSTLYVTFLFFT